MLTLLIGNKNYSSWSMRPWVAMKAAGIAFEEVQIRLDTPEFKAQVREFVGSDFMGTSIAAGKVPVLKHARAGQADLIVWDTLAIIETLHESFHENKPNAMIWPTDARQRARARSLCAEMHAGFGGVRGGLPMNIESVPAEYAHVQDKVNAPAVLADIARISQLWLSCLENPSLNAADGSYLNGAFLFGDWCAADAYFAPVVMRFNSYAVVDKLPAKLQAYCAAVTNHFAVQAWIQAALVEHDFIAYDEPYRMKK